MTVYQRISWLFGQQKVILMQVAFIQSWPRYDQQRRVDRLRRKFDLATACIVRLRDRLPA